MALAILKKKEKEKKEKEKEKKKEKKEAPRRCEGPESKRSRCTRERSSQLFDVQWRTPLSDTVCHWPFCEGWRPVKNHQSTHHSNAALTQPTGRPHSGPVGASGLERPRLKKYRFLFQILLKSDGFERWGRSEQVARSGRD